MNKKKLFWEKQSNRKFDLNNFRNSKKHNIFANWSPYKRGLTFHNFLINYFVNNNQKDFLKFKKSINNLNIGFPPIITYKNKYKISYDDCLSFEEISFLKKNFKKKKLDFIVEIGPGYGRMVETILKNFKVKKYIVIDYQNILKLTKKYLSKVLHKKEFSKIIFVNFENFKFKKDFFLEKFSIRKFDLLFNSDSFHEIEKKIIRNYQEYFSDICDNFFIKNSVGKYKPKDLINHLNDHKVPNFIKNLGFCNKVINIFDIEQIHSQIKNYVKMYNPYKKYKKIVYKQSEIYPSTLLCIFRK
tara:strand:+ start:857 stop:1756 length:900 start_codon:yes stop_codon:yes gene_type:complete